MSLRVVGWRILATDLKRCQWIERNRRCTAAPTQDLLLEFDPPTDKPRGQAVCEDHGERLARGDWPQRWSAPESAWMASERGLVFYTRAAP